MASTMLIGPWLGAACICVLLIPLLATVAMAIYLQYVRRKFSYLPSPKMLPHWSSYLLGHFNQMSDIRKGTKVFYELSLAWADEVGSVYVVFFLAKPVVVMLTKEAVKEFLIYGSHSKPEFLYRQVHTVLGERFMGSGLVTEHVSSLWEAKRSLFNPAFHRSYLKLSMETFNSSTEALMKRLKRKADGKTKIEMLDEFSRVTLDIIAKVGFGFDCESLTKERSKFIDAVTCSLNGCMYFERNFWKKYSLLPDVSTRRKEVKSAIKFLRDFGQEIVTKRIQKMNEEKDDRHDILSYILKATNGLKNSSFGMTGVLDEFITFFVAGMETSSVTLTSILFHLSRNEEIVKRLKAEVKEVLQGRTSVEYEDLAKLEYLNAVIKETLRMTPPASSTARQCNYDVEVSGYTIPKGCCVAVPFVMGRREEFFSDPLTFKPERFYRTMIEPHTFVPFAVGPRSCIGQQFALMEMKVIMARLLQTFDLRWVPGQSCDFIEEMTVKLKDGGLHYLTLCDNHNAENDQDLHSGSAVAHK